MYNISLLCTKHVDFLKRFGKFINKYEIDNTQIKKTILVTIKGYCGLEGSPNEIVFSEEEDNTYGDSENEDGEDDNTYENSEKDDNNDNEESIKPSNNENTIEPSNTELNESIINN